MRIALVVNDIQTEFAKYTTVLLGRALHNRGHQVFFVGIGDLSYRNDGNIGGLGYRANGKTYRSSDSFLKSIQGEDCSKENISTKDLDIIYLRNDPAAEAATREWARTAGIIFGQLASRQNTIVLNDPFSLSNALNKLYFQHFPESVRPKSIITRNPKEIQDFFKEQNSNIILKPLQGSGGKNVFVIKKDDHPNLNQIIEAISREGYIIAQEYLPEAVKGDTRLFVMNGQPLMHKGKYAAIQRVNKKDDIRSNMHAGGKATKPVITDEALELVRLIRPKLIQDGMFLVGLDIVGDKLLEINVFSPGGLHSCCELQEVDFTVPLINSLEDKIYYKNTYQGALSNKILGTM